jgi:cytidylate kinase
MPAPLAKALARRLGYVYVDTGAMYRAVTLYFLQHNTDLQDAAAVAQALTHITIDLRIVEGENRTYLNGTDVEEAIRSMQVSQHVSHVSALPAVRRAMVAQQQAIGTRKGIVMDGRDIGTGVFPTAELKLFLTAAPQVRSHRRHQELLAKGVDASLEDIHTTLPERDHIDTTREDSPLRKAEDAIVIDNTHLSREQQLEEAYQLALQSIAASGSDGL